MSKKMNELKIKERLERAFLIATGLPAIAAVIALIAMIVISNRYSSTLEMYGFAQGDVGKTMAYFSEVRSAMRGAIGYDEEEEIQSLVEMHDKYVELFEQSFADLESSMVSDANKKIYNDISKDLEEYWKLDKEIMELGATTDRALCEQAQEIAMYELVPIYEEIYSDMTSIMDIKVDRGDSISDLLSAICIVLMIAIGVVIVAAIFFSLRLGSNIADGISVPITELSERLEQFAQGDIFTPFPTSDSKDEVADMLSSAIDMATSLDFIISDMEHILGRMADSDYTVRSQDGSKYIGDYRQFFDSAKKMRDCMIDTMKFIEESSIQVTQGSNNLSETSLSLAEGATEQASAVEELQATITTITEAAQKAANDADGAYQRSQDYARMADDSSADIKEMVDAMERISEASKKIGNIISEIESIASQTNLLSLNASIEAARAGEAGRGFSVVADQIRQLAEQSSKSAVDTRELIEGAMQEVENGNKVAERAVASIATVVDGIREVAVSSKELSDASANQAVTLKEAEEGVNQISDVIQTNAAVAQESSATSQELAAQAASLDALIAKFNLPNRPKK